MDPCSYETTRFQMLHFPCFQGAHSISEEVRAGREHVTLLSSGQSTLVLLGALQILFKGCTRASTQHLSHMEVTANGQDGGTRFQPMVSERFATQTFSSFESLLT